MRNRNKKGTNSNDKIVKINKSNNNNISENNNINSDSNSDLDSTPLPAAVNEHEQIRKLKNTLDNNLINSLFGNIQDYNGYSFLQINLARSCSAMSALAAFIIEEKIDIIIFQDPHLNSLKVIINKSLWQVFTSNNNSCGIIITNPTIFAIISSISLNSIVLNITQNNKNKPIHICSVYSAPSSDFDQDLQIFQNYNNLENFIIGGDFNCKLVGLNYKYTCHRGNTMLEFIAANSLTLLNDSDDQSPSTFYTLKKGIVYSGNPDLTLVGQNIIDKIIFWYVDDSSQSGSDHRYIRYKFNLDIKQKINTRFKTKNSNFVKFNNFLKPNISILKDAFINSSSFCALDLAIQNFNNVILETCKKSFRNKSFKSFGRISWWNNNLRELRNRTSALYKKFKKSQNLDIKLKYKILYKQSLAKYKLEIQNAKLNSWRNYCSNNTDNFGTLFKLLREKNIKSTNLIHTVLENSNLTDDYQNIKIQLLQSHFDINTQLTINDPIEYSKNNLLTLPPACAPNVTDKELTYAMKCQRLGKAPGADLIDGYILKNLIKNHKELMKLIINKCLKLNYFPILWKSAIVIFFHKTSKNPLQPRSYRPICLLSMVGKLYERVIKQRLNYQLETNNLLHANQYGFRKLRNTTQLLNIIKTNIKQQLKEYRYCTLISFDIQGAFDNINWEALDEAIDELEIDQYLKNILKTFKSNRFIQDENSLSFFSISKGCPQGSCLGPVLWLLIANIILKRFSLIHPLIWAFADDFVVICSASSRSELEQKVNSLIKLFNDICNSLHLVVSADKTKALLLGSHTMDRRRPIFKLNNDRIEIVNNLKYLGIYLDSKLNWFTHLNNLKEKVSTFTYKLKKVNFPNWGVRRHLLILWYKTVTQQQILYGAEVWFPDLKSKGIKKLLSIQRLGLLAVAGAYKSTATVTLQIILGIPPIDIFIKHKAKKFYLKNNLITLNIDDKEITYNSLDIKETLPYYPPNINLNNIHIIDKAPKYKMNDIYIFTDGSKMESGTSMAFTVFYNNHYIYDHFERLNFYNSIFQAECLAIQKAIQWSILNNLKEIYIFTDSISALLNLNNLYPKDNITCQTLLLLSTNSNLKINLCWVKAHVNVEGNERADALAKLPLKYNLEINNPKILIPLSYLNSYLNNNILNDWQHDWNNSLNGRYTYEFVPRVSLSLLHTDTIVFYFITGHGSFPTYLYRIGKKHDKLCDCGEEGSPLHYVFGGCPLMPYSFKYSSQISLYENFMLLIQKNILLKRLKVNYRKLDELYSFKYS